MFPNENNPFVNFLLTIIYGFSFGIGFVAAQKLMALI